MDYVVQIDAIGDRVWHHAHDAQSRCARHGTDGGAGHPEFRLLRDGFSFPEPAPAARTLATAICQQIMPVEQIHGGYAQGGITGAIWSICSTRAASGR